MQTRDAFPRPVIEEETWIPMPDGCHLAARIRRPADAEAHPVPAILEYLPYRKRDLTAERDAHTHGYFAGHGYAGVRVDIRGTGESGGVLTDEYTQQEFDDGLAVLRWLADQPWCTGDVGMIGISWGGFNGLQLASFRPPELKCVITLGSTDDRYADDIHHMGGTLLVDNLSWAATMFEQTSCPPDPALVGESWREMWLDRLHGSGHWLETWLHHQRRDGYYEHGSVCENYDAIQCPVYTVGGWADGYVSAIFRLMRGLSVPRKALIGPWAHNFPHFGSPGPAIGFLQECLRWFDHWLKGVDTGIMAEPMVRAWVQDSAPPRPHYDERPGRWVAEDDWPGPNVQPTALTLTPRGQLAASDDGERAPRAIRSPLTTGVFGGKWCPYMAPPDLPADQRGDDAGSLVFQTDTLAEDVEILGQPSVTLECSVDRPVAMVCARLIDVRPDGSATRVSYGLFNLTHRDGHAEPQPLTPGERYRVTVPLKYIGQRFPAGHAIRVSLSTVYWPVAWPAPEPVTLTVHTGESQLTLPVRPPQPSDAELPAFGPPEGAPPLPVTRLAETDSHWTVTHDLPEAQTQVDVLYDQGLVRFDDIGLTVHGRVRETYTVRDDDEDTLEGWCAWDRVFRRGDWETRTYTRTRLTSDATHFYLEATLDAYEGTARVCAKSWNTAIPRDLV